MARTIPSAPLAQATAGGYWFGIRSITPQWLTYLSENRDLVDEDGNTIVFTSPKWIPILSHDDEAVDYLSDYIVEDTDQQFYHVIGRARLPVAVYGHAQINGWAVRVRLK